MDGDIRASKFYCSEESWTRRPAWWVQIPTKRLYSARHFDVLCEQATAPGEFYHLRVPADYLIDHLPQLEIVDDKISLFLSAEGQTVFQDERGPGRVPFGRFLQSRFNAAGGN